MRAYPRSTLRYISISLALALASTAQGQFTGFGSKSAGSKQQADDQKASKLLHEKLPLVLDANTAYPTVPDEDLLGGPFHGRMLPITLETLTKPLPPGDWVVPTTFFCSEYSIHRGGEGVAYTLGPAQGTSAKAISTLLWRGMLTGHSPQELQSVSWAIQGSVPYDKMPPKYKALVDQLIPEMKNQVNGQAFADIEDGFQGKVNRVTKKLAEGISKGTGGFVHADIKVDAELNGSFARLGRLGQMALDGESVSNIVTASFPTDQAREQALYAGQGQQAPPIPPMNGPWSVMVPGVAYMRFAVHGGNLQGDNAMQIRILQPRSPVAQAYPLDGPHFQLAGYTPPPIAINLTPSLLRLFGGVFDDAVFAVCVAGTEGLGALGPCEALATVVAGMIGYGINSAVQAPNIVLTVPMNLPSSPKSGQPRGGRSRASGAPPPDDPNEATRLAKLIATLRAALRGKGNFGLGEGTAAEVDEIGKAWVGDDYKASSNGKALISEDGLRQYRLPSSKPQLGMNQANFESRLTPNGEWQSNGHLDIVK